VPRELVVELLAETIEIQSNGGMTAENGQPRSAGGVFLTFMKKHKSVTKDTRKKINRVQRERKVDKRFAAALVGLIDLESN
jgi:hypothetical protein